MNDIAIHNTYPFCSHCKSRKDYVYLDLTANELSVDSFCRAAPPAAFTEYAFCSFTRAKGTILRIVPVALKSIIDKKQLSLCPR